MKLYGIIAADMLGSQFEGKKPEEIPRVIRWNSECRFTDDTILTCAVADSMLTGAALAENLRKFYLYFPQAGYGPKFSEWCWFSGGEPYNSLGNGAAMRAGSCGWHAQSIFAAWDLGKWSASPTHNHKEGVKGARAVALGMFLLRQGYKKETVGRVLKWIFKYKWDLPLSQLKPGDMEPTCQHSMPLAIRAFMTGHSFVEVIQTAIKYGGDTDTIACIAAALAEVTYPIPNSIITEVEERLDDKLLRVVQAFNQSS